jgi:hypothetical protein
MGMLASVGGLGFFTKPDPIRFKGPLIGDKGHILGVSLRNQHAVKRVLVRTGQQTGTDAVFNRNIQRGETFPQHEGLKVSGKLRRSWQPTESHLGSSLPRRGGAHQKHITGLCHRFARSAGKSRIITQPPEQSVGVDEGRTAAYSQAESSSAGSGSKNSGPTRSFARKAPGCRRPCTSPMATRRTTGVAPRAMMMAR